jgi:hypothetical protein
MMIIPIMLFLCHKKSKDREEKRQSRRSGSRNFFFRFLQKKIFSRVKSRVEHKFDFHLSIVYHDQDFPTFNKKMPTLPGAQKH